MNFTNVADASSKTFQVCYADLFPFKILYHITCRKYSLFLVVPLKMPSYSTEAIKYAHLFHRLYDFFPNSIKETLEIRLKAKMTIYGFDV